MEKIPYDDVFRTMLNDCSGLIIPLINETFNENYTGDEAIIFGPNEHFLNRQDGVSGKTIQTANMNIQSCMITHT